MKHADFKVAAGIINGHPTIAAKKKNGLLFMMSDTHPVKKNECCFSSYLGGNFVIVEFYLKKKQNRAKIIFPCNKPTLYLPIKSKNKFQQFLETDYHGYKLK